MLEGAKSMGAGAATMLQRELLSWEEEKWERAEREQSKFQWWAVFTVPFHWLFLGKSHSNQSQGATQVVVIERADAA
ncbi:hypothetical protein H5410_027836 [Solanum commersonii]|uniref:Uncharacterized protein n=1 Tax=Solanum commersonii TaxID=4109 RepID=A0A9J5Z313_SOLCO|nr:hypothetical protein H5410_027836 [Solanum commersonii]